MSLAQSKIVYLFVDALDIHRLQGFFEEALGLEAVENTFHPPHHRHGVVKYDAGDTILALNVADSAFEPAGSDRVVTVLRASPMREAQIYARLQSCGLAAPLAQAEPFADPDGHRYVVVQQGESEPWRLEEQPPRIDALRLSVDDLAESIQFYGERLGLTPVGASPASATFATGNVDLVLEQAVPPVIGRSPRWGFLTVFYTPDIQKTRTSLMRAGVPGITDARFSQIGGTARFKDPTGHRICLYQPSEECFGWESGALLQQIVSGPVRAAMPATLQ